MIGNSEDLQGSLLEAMHADPNRGHSGVQGTYMRAKDLIHYKGLKKDIAIYVAQCDVCQRNKEEHVKSPGLLQPLPIPEAAWKDISIDFVEGLPKSVGKEIILVVVDRFTKYSHFIALSHPITAPHFFPNYFYLITTDYMGYLLLSLQTGTRFLEVISDGHYLNP